MEFKATKGIFIQIADRLCHEILDGKLLANDRVPSVRDLASELEVNRNTVMRSFSYLQGEDILFNKRGVGFFVSENAVEMIKRREKQAFFENEKPYLLEKIRLLQLNSTDLQDIIAELNKND